MIKLPKAAIETTAFSRDSSTQSYYTEAQLKQYGRDVLEEAAQVCDAQRERLDVSSTTAKGVKARDIYSAAAQTAYWNAVAIRALIKEIEA